MSCNILKVILTQPRACTLLRIIRPIHVSSSELPDLSSVIYTVSAEVMTEPVHSTVSTKKVSEMIGVINKPADGGSGSRVSVALLVIDIVGKANVRSRIRVCSVVILFRPFFPYCE